MKFTVNSLNSGFARLVITFVSGNSFYIEPSAIAHIVGWVEA
ncbi:hypothetical protein [Microcoleus sp. EPA2]